MYKSKKGFKLRKLGDEFILIGEGIEQVNFNKMITMNETAAFLWEKAEALVQYDAALLADYLLAEYDVQREQALQDAQTTLDKWLDAGLIVDIQQ